MTMLPTPFARPLYVMAKPAGPACNLGCEYCYYLEKDKLFAPGTRKADMLMDDRLLERYICEYIESQTTPFVSFCWHGGEAMLRGLDFYRRVVRIQQRYAGRIAIENSLQTNGTLMTAAWAQFFADNRWLIGVSIDGPADMHDPYRRTRGGQPTHAKVMQGIGMLNRFGVDWNALAVVNNLTGQRPLDFYHFFKEIGCRYLQFTPVVERLQQHADGRQLASLRDASTQMAPYSVTPQQWGDFLCAVFDEWVRHDVGTTFVQLFDATLANHAGVEPGVCTLAADCGHALAMEYNGDVYSCDHFVFPEYKLGNLRTTTLVDMLESPQQREFAKLKRNGLPDQCRRCPQLSLCHGECPRNRFMTTAAGQPGLNYLCEGYRRFFAHSRPAFEYMADLLRRDQPPALVMERYR